MPSNLIPYHCPPCDATHRGTAQEIRNILAAVLDGDIQKVTRNGIITGDCLQEFEHYNAGRLKPGRTKDSPYRKADLACEPRTVSVA